MHKPEMIEKYLNDYASSKFGNNPSPLPKKKVYVDFLDDEFVKETRIEIPLKKGDFVLWNSCLPHNGGINTLSDHWRLHAFVRFLAMEGPCVDSDSLNWSHLYQKISRRCMQTGEKPSHYSTGNTVRSENNTLEVPLHKPIELSWLGDRLWGIENWTSSPPVSPPSSSSAKGDTTSQKKSAKKNRVQGGWSSKNQPKTNLKNSCNNKE
jgi:hypothetical protein